MPKKEYEKREDAYYLGQFDRDSKRPDVISNGEFEERLYYLDRVPIDLRQPQLLETVRFAWEQTTDFFSLLRLIQFALEHPTKKVQEQILQKLEADLKVGEAVLTRSAISTNPQRRAQISQNEDLKELAKHQFQTFAQRVADKISRSPYAQTYPWLNRFVREVVTRFPNVTKPYNQLLQVPTLSPEVSLSANPLPKLRIMSEQREPVTNRLMRLEAVAEIIENRDQLFKEQVALADLVWATDDVKPHSPYGRIDNLATTRFGGHSLQELFVIQNKDKFGQAVLDYLIAMPKRDWIWVQFARLLFFQPLILSDVQNLPHSPLVPDLVKIQDFHAWVAEKLLLPFVNSQSIDYEFKTKLTELLRHLPGASVISFAGSVSANLTMYVGNLSKLQLNGQEIQQESALYRLATRHLPPAMVYYQRFEYMHFLREMLPVAQLNQYFLVEWASTVPQVTEFVLTLAQVWGFFGDEIEQETYQQHLFEHTGEEFLLGLQADEEQIANMTAMIWEDIAQLRVKFWPHPQASYQMNFSPGSFAAAVGLKSIDYFVQDDATQPVHFFIKTRFGGVDTQGTFNALTQTCDDFSLTLMPKWPVVQKLIAQIVLLTFRDLVTRSSQLNQPAPVQMPSLVPEVVDQGELTRQLEKQAHKNTKIKYVGAYPRALGSANTLAEIKTAVQLYVIEEHAYLALQTQPDSPEITQQLEIQTANLLAARALMEQALLPLRKISHEKAEKIPEALRQLEQVVNPVTGEVVFLETWVKSHTSPRIEDDTQASLADQFSRRKLITGSALQALELLMKDRLIDSHHLAA
ncbi:MAG TPA: hypothetical protein VD999_00150 [Vitreimonas sp.]|nr:hypothetical protein [Vitreimonas sp.]